MANPRLRAMLDQRVHAAAAADRRAVAERLRAGAVGKPEPEAPVAAPSAPPKPTVAVPAKLAGMIRTARQYAPPGGGVEMVPVEVDLAGDLAAVEQLMQRGQISHAIALLAGILAALGGGDEP